MTMQQQFERMQAAARSNLVTDLATRKDRLNRLERLLLDNQDALIEAIDADFGNRSATETKAVEFLPLILMLRYSRRRLRRWMRPERCGVHWLFMPSVAKVMPQPLGVIGIMSPWNYPLFLSIGPLIDALAAGNRAMIKPSEVTPQTSDLLQQLFAEQFAADEVTVITGDVDASVSFSKLPFDHLIFTGSTAVGRHVAAAAAVNLTPVTLELGGKSPVILGEDYPLKKAAAQLAYGRILNAGQTCVATEYVLAPKDKLAELGTLIQAQMAKKLPDMGVRFAAIVSDKYYQRQIDMLAEIDGRAEILVHGQDDPKARKLAPRIVIDPPDGSKITKEEVFGPILFLKGYDNLDDAIAYVTARPRPLSLYCFTNRAATRRRVLTETISGNVNVNGAISHISQPTLPFGGVGESGYGSYHGHAGFQRFSHMKAVHQLGSVDPLLLFGPPWARLTDFVTKFMLRR
ncbi:MAG: aldehyde dehydrogenase family protein [Pseudomonadota bacterium]